MEKGEEACRDMKSHDFSWKGNDYSLLGVVLVWGIMRIRQVIL